MWTSPQVTCCALTDIKRLVTLVRENWNASFKNSVYAMKDRYFFIPEWSDELRGKQCKRNDLLGGSERKKKVALVSGKRTFSQSVTRRPHRSPFTLKSI